MNKYNNNNFSRAPENESPNRFNKRSRFGANSNGNNSSQRFKHQNLPGYQYSQNRNNAVDYKSNQYEKGTNRHSYINSPKRLNYNHQQQNKQLSPYTQKSPIPSSISKTFSKFSASSKNVSNLGLPQTNKLVAPTAPPATVSQNSQQLQQQFPSDIIDSSNYYGFGYNFYPNYNTDLITTASSTTFSAVDGLNPYIWQTITSTPPPKLPQQQQPPLPPLPPHQPPPPLPSSDDLPQLPPPPPMPECFNDSATNISEKTDEIDKSKDQESVAKTIIKMKTKRKAMSVRYKLSKSWSEKDALLALKAEETISKNHEKDIMLIIRFPDPEISREMVKCYSPDIESVHFQLNFAPRYCLVHLKPGADVEKTMDHISKISFGTGNLSVEIKEIPQKAHSTKLNEIDPFTLYVGNLPTTIAVKTLKDHFPGASRIDIGFAQRMKYTRYAFIRYQNVQQAIEAYTRMYDTEIGGRNLTIRFRRLTAASDGNKEVEVENRDGILHDEIISQTTVATENNITQLYQTSCDDPNAIDDIVTTNKRHDSNDLASITEKQTTETGENTANNSTPAKFSTATTETNLPINEPLIQEKPSSMHRNIKPDPDIDPEDIVIRKNTVPSRVLVTDNNIKREEENFALYMEFFEKPNNQNDVFEKSSRSDIHSLSSTADERDTMSPLSTNSLGDFLQTCHRRQTTTDNIEELGPPAKKINKNTGENLQATVKMEPLEKSNTRRRETLQLFRNESVEPNTIKQEAVQNSINLNTRNKNSSVNREKFPVSHHSRKYNKTSNSDDMVPPTALFFRSDYQNMLPNAASACDYDEFYETRVVPHSSTSLGNVKKEIINTNEINTQVTQNERLNRSRTATYTGKEKYVINSTAASNSIDDDLVPAQNLLGSYRPLQSSIKMEAEHADIFSVPLNTTSRTNETISSSHDSDTSLTSHSSVCEKKTETTKTDIAEDNDEGVVIVSDNIKRASNNVKSNNSIGTNLFIPRQTDLVSFTYKTVSALTLPNPEVSKLLYPDYLDKLYEQLDADSDNEL